MIAYRGYTLTPTPSGVEVRWTLRPDEVVEIASSVDQARADIDGWLWAS